MTQETCKTGYSMHPDVGRKNIYCLWAGSGLNCFDDFDQLKLRWKRIIPGTWRLFWLRNMGSLCQKTIYNKKVWRWPWDTWQVYVLQFFRRDTQIIDSWYWERRYIFSNRYKIKVDQWVTPAGVTLHSYATWISPMSLTAVWCEVKLYLHPNHHIC